MLGLKVPIKTTQNPSKFEGYLYNLKNERRLMEVDSGYYFRI